MEPGSTGGGSFCRGKNRLFCCKKKKEKEAEPTFLHCMWTFRLRFDCSLVSVLKQADPVVVLNDNNAVVITSNRLQEGSVPPLEQGMVVGQLVLADSLIIGNCNNQVLTH